MSADLEFLKTLGDTCTQAQAARALGVSKNTVFRMLADGRLVCKDKHVDVCSVRAYLKKSNGKRKYRLIHRGAAYLQKNVADVCVNCTHPRCIDQEHGCADYRAEFRRVARRTGAREK